MRLIRMVVDVRSEIGESGSEKKLVTLRRTKSKNDPISISHAAKSPLARFPDHPTIGPVLDIWPHRIRGPYLGGIIRNQCRPVNSKDPEHEGCCSPCVLATVLARTRHQVETPHSTRGLRDCSFSGSKQLVVCSHKFSWCSYCGLKQCFMHHA